MPIARMSLAAVVGITTFLAAQPAGCDDIGGVPSWERCRSWLDTPTVEWPLGMLGDLVFPLLIAAAAGALVWWIAGSVGLGT